MTEIKFWLDPNCPWTYAASKWLEEVSKKRDVAVSWQLFSLGALNQETPDAPMPRSAAATRIMAAAMEEHGNDVLYPLYCVIARRLHDEKQQDYDTILSESLAELQLPPGLVKYRNSEEYDDVLRASVAAAAEAVGRKTGIPVISFDGRGFNGPIISPRPQGEEALKLWDSLASLAQIPGFYQIQRRWDHGANPA